MRTMQLRLKQLATKCLVQDENIVNKIWDKPVGYKLIAAQMVSKVPAHTEPKFHHCVHKGVSLDTVLAISIRFTPYNVQ
jgi:hypothetical protein